MTSPLTDHNENAIFNFDDFVAIKNRFQDYKSFSF
jgi:hypothetical protein